MSNHIDFYFDIVSAYSYIAHKKIQKIKENKINSKYYTIPVQGGNANLVEDYKSLLADATISPDGKFLLFSKEVKVEKLLGKDLYPELSKTTAQVYTGLDYRHWDTWNDGTHNHVFYSENKKDAVTRR